MTVDPLDDIRSRLLSQGPPYSLSDLGRIREENRTDILYLLERVESAEVTLERVRDLTRGTAFGVVTVQRLRDTLDRPKSGR